MTTMPPDVYAENKERRESTKAFLECVDYLRDEKKREQLESMLEEIATFLEDFAGIKTRQSAIEQAAELLMICTISEAPAKCTIDEVTERGKQVAIWSKG